MKTIDPQKFYVALKDGGSVLAVVLLCKPILSMADVILSKILDSDTHIEVEKEDPRWEALREEIYLSLSERFKNKTLLPEKNYER